MLKLRNKSQKVSAIIYRYKKMWYECQWDNSIQVTIFKSKPKYGLQHRALAMIGICPNTFTFTYYEWNEHFLNFVRLALK